MSPDAGFEQRFANCLECEHGLLLELLVSLERMKLALLDGSSVEHLLQEKEQLLARIESTTGQRRQLLLECGISLGRGNLGDDLAAHNCSPQLVGKYREFEKTVTDCQRQNQALGRLAKRREGLVNRALKTLDATSSASTYSASGFSDGFAGTRHLGSA